MYLLGGMRVCQDVHAFSGHVLPVLPIHRAPPTIGLSKEGTTIPSEARQDKEAEPGTEHMAPFTVMGE